MLAAHGTINDLAVAGAEPRWLTLGVIPGRARIASCAASSTASLAKCVPQCARVVAGDTKSFRAGGGGAYFGVSGVGDARRGSTSRARQEGDALLVSGSVGDHGIAELLAREDFDLRSAARSDCAPVLCRCALCRCRGCAHCATRRVAGWSRWRTIAQGSGRTLRLREAAVPVRDPTRSVCEMLGRPARCEGRVVAVVAAADAPRALPPAPGGRSTAAATRPASAASSRQAGRWSSSTALGGERLLDELPRTIPLPRIC